MARIRQARQTDALIAREELGRATRNPTFSLREALVMAASLLIVAFLLIPSIQQSRVRQRIYQCAANMGQIGTDLQHYANDNNQHLPTVGGHDLRWLPGEDHVASNSEALFKLVTGNYAPASLFVCPAVADNLSFHVAPHMIDFPDAKTIHYSYQHTIGPHDLSFNDPATAAVNKEMVILGDSTPLYRNGSFDAQQADKACSENHGRTGQNVLYLDLHVRWVESRPSA